jgi:EmrB/QacA subfamily drug resistance transporter
MQPLSVPTIASRSHLGGYFSLAMAIFLASLGTSIANVALPFLKEAFEASFQQIQWVVLAYLLAITIVIAAVGKLADSYGAKRLFLYGIALFGVSTLGCALAPSLNLLIGARVLQGIGAATMMALSMALMTQTVAKAESGKALALLGTMSAIGTAVGPVLGGFLLAMGSWPAIFWVSLPVTFLTFILARKYLPDDNRQPLKNQPFDLRGALVLAIALASYALAMTMNRASWDSTNLQLISCSFIALLLFIRWQRAGANPLIRIALFSQPIMRNGFILSALVMAIMMTTLVVGPFYLAFGLQLDAALLGVVMAAGPVTVAISGPFTGYFVDKLGADPTTRIGLTSVVLGTALLAVLPFSTGIAGYIGLITVGYSLFQNANNTAVMTNALANERSLVAALLHLSRNLGLITGASLMGAIFMRACGTDNLASAAPETVFHAMQTTFGVAAVATFILTALVTVVLPSTRSHKV